MSKYENQQPSSVARAIAIAVIVFVAVALFYPPALGIAKKELPKDPFYKGHSVPYN